MTVATSRSVMAWRLAAAVVAVSVLLGWACGIEWLITWGGKTEMVPNTAACIILLSLAMTLRSEVRRWSLPVMVTDGFALVVLVISVVVLSQIDLGLDAALYAYVPRMGSGVSVSGRMGQGTALSLVLLVAAMLLPARYRPVVSVLACVSAGLGSVWGATSAPTVAAVGLLAIASARDRRHVRTNSA